MWGASRSASAAGLAAASRTRVPGEGGGGERGAKGARAARSRRVMAGAPRGPRCFTTPRRRARKASSGDTSTQGD
jgi:hypothetical protein